MTGAAEHAVRHASEEDAASIAEVWLRSRHAAADIPPPVHSDDEVRAWVSGLLLPTHEVWVATEGAVVGMLALDHGWIAQLYVSPDHQRRGHGERLLRVAQSEHDELALWTFESNLVARRFYESHGFTQSGAPSSDNEEGVPAVCYRWRRPE